MTRGNFFPYYWPFVRRIHRSPVDQSGGVPSQRDSNVEFRCLSNVSLNKLLNKRSSCQWSGTPWRSYDLIVVCLYSCSSVKWWRRRVLISWTRVRVGIKTSILGRISPCWPSRCHSVKRYSGLLRHAIFKLGLALLAAISEITTLVLYLWVKLQLPFWNYPTFRWFGDTS